MRDNVELSDDVFAIIAEIVHEQSSRHSRLLYISSTNLHNFLFHEITVINLTCAIIKVISFNYNCGTNCDFLTTTVSTPICSQILYIISYFIHTNIFPSIHLSNKQFPFDPKRPIADCQRKWCTCMKSDQFS